MFIVIVMLLNYVFVFNQLYNMVNALSCFMMRFHEILGIGNIRRVLSQFFSAVRGFLARWKMKPIVEERNNAASRIQAIVRGFVERCRYAKNKQISNESAVVLQSGNSKWLIKLTI